MDNKNPIQSAERIFQVLEYLAEFGQSGVVEIGNALELHKSTVHRMLISLTYMGYVNQEEKTGKYALTFKLVRLSSKLLDKTDIVSIAHPILEQLANICQETVHLVQRVGADVVYIDKIEPVKSRDSSIRMASRIGLITPMYCSGVGKAILARIPTDEMRAIWESSKIEKKTENTIISFDKLKEEIKKVDECGYALDNEENELGVRCIAAAVSDYHGQVKYAFSISAPINRMTDERILELSKHVLKTQGELSKQLG